MNHEHEQSTIDHHRSPASVLQEIRQLAPQYRSLQYQFAALLEMVHRYQYWRSAYKSFGDYVECETGLKLRTAQELIRVYRTCAQHGISRERVLELGWTKLALVASKIHEGNREQVLHDIKAQSYADLKRKYRSKTSNQRSSTRFQLSPVVVAALRLAACYSQSNDIADNLEFLAVSFVQNVKQRSRHVVRMN
ncbi:MAG: hypothetical protein KDA93_16870 [Planctomycetaceae bacterium]|nr:hypothetical protein [Planctomycetaceae bacterium]